MQIIQFLGDLFNLILLQPFINLMIILVGSLGSIGVPGALGFSIIIVTILVTFITWPFRASQIKHSKHTAEKMAELKPQFEALKEKHKDNRMAFEQAKAVLLKEHGVNPAAGCLPSLIPVILILPLYQVFLAFFGGDKGLQTLNFFAYFPSLHLESLPSTDFFGINLAIKPWDSLTKAPLVLLIPVVSGFLTFAQTKMMIPARIRHYKTDSVRETKEKEKSEDMSEVMQSQMSLMMPLMIAVFAFQFPIGLALYWNTLTIIGIIQQYLVAGWGGLSEYVARFRA